MIKFIQTFKQYFTEKTDDEEKETSRHLTVKQREKAQHDRILDTGGREGTDAEKTRHRSARKAEQLRHIAHHGSKYRYSGKSTTS
jgi:hypothetical protein